MQACGALATLLFTSLILSSGTGSPIADEELRQGRSDPINDRLDAPLYNKGMCGGDMNGGMIGPDCQPTKSRVLVRFSVSLLQQNTEEVQTKTLKQMLY
jgi:hypothetical protein